METLKQNLGMRIKELRRKKNLSQEKFAEMVSLDRRSISNIECGKTFPSGSLLKIAEVLNVSLKELFDVEYIAKSNEELVNLISLRLKNLNSEQLKIIYRLTEIL